MIGHSLGIKTKQRYVDIIKFGNRETDTRSGEEIAQDVISKMGLEVVD